MFLHTLQFALLCIYNFVFLVMVKLLSDTNAYVRWKPLKIASKTDSRTKTGQSWWKAEWKEKKKKAKDNLCVDANGPVLGCVRSTACRQSVSVFWWMRACMAFRWQCCTVIRRKGRACPRADSISVEGWRSTRFLTWCKHAGPSPFDTFMLTLSFKYYQCFEGLFFQKEKTENHRWPSKRDESAALFTIA